MLRREQHRRISKAHAYLHHVQEQQHCVVSTKDNNDDNINEAQQPILNRHQLKIPSAKNEPRRKSLVDLKKFFVDDKDAEEDE